MKKNLAKVFLFALFFFLLCSFQKQENTVLLKGEICGINSDTLLLVKTREGISSAVKIPVTCNSFIYELEADFVEKYGLIIQEELQEGYFRTTEFFPDTCTIKFELYPSEKFEKKIISGGELNKKMTSFKKETSNLFMPKYKSLEKAMDSLRSKGNLYTPEFKRLQEKIGKTDDPDKLVRLNTKRNRMSETGEAFTEEAKALSVKMDSINQKMVTWQKKYIKEHDHIYSYSLLISLITQYSTYEGLIEKEFLTGAFRLFKEKYPDHPYTEKAEKLIKTIAAPD